MEKQIEVMKQSMELADTILEGLQHIQKILSEGKGQQTVFLFEDVLIAHTTIGKSIEPVLQKLDNENIPDLQAKLSKSAELVVTAYEEKTYAKVQEILQFTLVPQFKKLKTELEQVFQPYVVS